ncbi:MAG: transcriptional repressor [Desulfuromonadales bacterium]|nr:transcriptional repressor [Desulfuromonadales bacterium]
MTVKRNTVQRQIILDILKKFHIHPTVDEVYVEIQKAHPTISKATVYRNLRQLAESGEIRQVSMSDDPERYDRRADHHYHFKCKICGKILDVDIDHIKGINEVAQQKYGVKIDEHDVTFKGICPECIKNSK